eukprot:SAG31_NODE_4466_length_3209_cov_2.035370_2_plen_135_part_00
MCWGLCWGWAEGGHRVDAEAAEGASSAANASSRRDVCDTRGWLYSAVLKTFGSIARHGLNRKGLPCGIGPCSTKFKSSSLCKFKFRNEQKQIPVPKFRYSTGTCTRIAPVSTWRGDSERECRYHICDLVRRLLI